MKIKNKKEYCLELFVRGDSHLIGYIIVDPEFSGWYFKSRKNFADAIKKLFKEVISKEPINHLYLHITNPKVKQGKNVYLSKEYYNVIASAIFNHMISLLSNENYQSGKFGATGIYFYRKEVEKI